MERSRYGGSNFSSEPINGVGFAPNSSLQPDINSKSVQDALRHLASIDLIDLCNEAKVEHCRASRDLRSCGRLVESVLISCGHASLCAECSQRCESCPICRTTLPKNGNILRLRLYHECVEAGLISKSCDDQSQEDDVQRLYSLFDVALEQNLCCLICQYVTDVCMDESAVSSDPVIAFLLDEVVVKNWCKRAFKNIRDQVRQIYNHQINEMAKELGALLNIASKLAGLCNVLDVLDMSFKDAHSAKLDDLHQLQESISKTKQHMEMMMWCIRHQFLEGIKPCHSNIFSWCELIRERKTAAIERAWPEAAEHSGESQGQDNSSLFIEDALLNLEFPNVCEQASEAELEVLSLQKDRRSSLFRSKIERLVGCYPFENVRAAVDMLFLCGSADVVVAKRAIFLYYLFDRHHTVADEEWKFIIDDFAATFSIPRHLLLESFIFYLLDDHTDEALQEACHLLPEISGPGSHPKIAKVLLERQNPDAALMFLRWSGHDSGAGLASLSEAVTAVRVRVECGLLTEAFMYQRMLCLKIKEKRLKHKTIDPSDNLEGEYRSWADWVLVLVTEICCLCIRRNLVDLCIGLPWSSDEEKHLHKCLLDYAMDCPSTAAGSLLVVYYLQRHRYIDAYHIDRKLQKVEEDYLSKNKVDENVLQRMNSSSRWRAGLVNKSLELLPEIEQQNLKAGNLPEDTVLCGNEIDGHRENDTPMEQDQVSTLCSASSSFNSSLLPMKHDISFQSPISGTLKRDGHARDTQTEFVNVASPSHSRGSLFKHSGTLSKTRFGNVKSSKLDDMLNLAGRSMRPSTVKDNRISSRPFEGDIQDGQLDEIFLQMEQNGSYGRFPKVSPPSTRRVMAKPTRTPTSNRGLFDDSSPERFKTASAKRLSPGDGPRNMVSSVDAMDISWSQEENNSPAADVNISGAPRWRSDEASDEEEQPSPEILRTLSSHPTPLRRSSRRVRSINGQTARLSTHL